MSEDAGCEQRCKMWDQAKQCPSLHKMGQADQTLCEGPRADPDELCAEQKMSQIEKMLGSRAEPCAGQGKDRTKDEENEVESRAELPARQSRGQAEQTEGAGMTMGRLTDKPCTSQKRDLADLLPPERRISSQEGQLVSKRNRKKVEKKSQEKEKVEQKSLERKKG